MFKRVLIAIGLMIIIIGCETIKPKNDNNNTVKQEDKKEETVTREETPKMKVTVYGQ